MAPLAKGGVAEAESQSVPTLKVDKVIPVLLMLSHTSSDAEEFIFFEHLYFLISGLDAVF